MAMSRVVNANRKLLLAVVITISMFYVGFHSFHQHVMKPSCNTALDKNCKHSIGNIERRKGNLSNPASFKNKDSSVQRNKNDSAVPVKKKVILFWTTFYFEKDFGVGYGDAPFRDCPVKNCVTTSDRSRNVSADALIYHMRNVDGRTVFPAGRGRHQRYVFFLLEHPHHQWNDLRNYAGVFNWTMTYRTDSDVTVLYGKVFSNNYSAPDSFLVRSVEETPPPHTSTIPFKMKKKSVAWFVSNCHAQSKRGQYVDELKKYIDVDIYGQCGDLVCPPGKKWHQGLMDRKCYQMLQENYKFYLSFENNICKDYVTEKLFNALQLDVVPVVYGAVNYSSIAPPHSFIDIHQFKSPKDLAAFLHRVGDNENEYNTYLSWKKAYYIETHKMKRKSFCDLCAKLNDPTEPDKVYNNLDGWWGKSTVCDLQHMQNMRLDGNW